MVGSICVLSKALFAAFGGGGSGHFCCLEPVMTVLMKISTCSAVQKCEKRPHAAKNERGGEPPRPPLENSRA